MLGRFFDFIQRRRSLHDQARFTTVVFSPRMFKFGFNDPSATTNATPDDGAGTIGNDLPEPEAPNDELPAQRVDAVAGDAPSQCVPAWDVVELAGGQMTLRKVAASVPNHLAPMGTDIVPTQYEGGFKLWESAIDLADYLHGRPELVRGKVIAELGAGHALPAMVALRAGATRAVVHDYNVEVVRTVCMTNVKENVCDATTGFYAGGWWNLADVIEEKLDLVLAAETVYARSQVVSLARCVVRLLAPGGVALIAGKQYYFGVGGGMREFEEEVKRAGTRDGLRVETKKVWERRDGVSNVREILEIRQG